MTRLIRAAAAAAFLFVTIPAGLVAADTAEKAPDLGPAPYATEQGFTHWVGEFEPGSDLEHYANWVLDKVGVAPEEFGSRIPAGGIMEQLDMVWLLLTPTEAEQANSLIGQAPLNAAETTSVVSLPEPVDGGGPFVAPGQRGRQFVPAGITRIGVPVDDLEAPGSVRVAVVDTGIDGRHPDLPRVAGGFNCTQDNRGPEGYDIDVHGHATVIAGEIGALDNDRDVVGVHPGVAMYSEVVFGAEGSASGAMVLCGVNQALEDGVDIISASLGGGSIATRCGGPSVYVNGWCKAAQRAVVVVAAGNDTVDAINKAPANVDAPAVVTVGAVVDYDGEPGGQGLGYPGCGFEHLDDALATFSNFGHMVDVVAPGGCVMSTLPAAGLGWMSGTSMATPYVSGVFSAFMARFPDCRGADAVRAVLGYAERYAREHPDEGYSGWPGADPPPLIRYVEEEPLTYQDPDNPRPCAFQSSLEGVQS